MVDAKGKRKAGERRDGKGEVVQGQGAEGREERWGMAPLPRLSKKEIRAVRSILSPLLSPPLSLPSLFLVPSLLFFFFLLPISIDTDTDTDADSTPPLAEATPHRRFEMVQHARHPSHPPTQAGTRRVEVGERGG